MSLNILTVVLLVSLNAVLAVHTGAFRAHNWAPERNHNDHEHSFVVALGLRNRDVLLEHFHNVSNPRNEAYGQFLSLDEIQAKYSPSSKDVLAVSTYFSGITNSKVTLNRKGDMLTVTAKVSHIERHLGTSLQWHKHISGATNKRSLRATSPLANVPEHLSDKIAFISLNSPINHAAPSGGRHLKEMDKLSEQARTGTVILPISVVAGNKEALIQFQPVCGDGSINTANPPCAGLPADQIPKFTVSVAVHNNIMTNDYLVTADPLKFELSNADIYCNNNVTKSECAGAAEPGFCVCIAKLSPLPMYVQLKANLTAVFTSGIVSAVGQAPLFTLTDVATVSFLSDLYNIPRGIQVNNKKATQGLAEFYGEYYSNTDLAKFLALSGLPDATLPVENILYGTNNENKPGGEAQLDVEYLMGLAPGSPTYFYSMPELNPYDADNEGFLTWLQLVANAKNPPLVQSLSYADVEVSVFMPDNKDSYNYGVRCDEEFMQLGLRGVSILVSSGDDGLGGTDIRKDVAKACSKAWATWPSSSPYITSIGGTQLTDQYLPGCGQPYSSGMAASSTIQPETELIFQCTGTRETVCSGATGGVITSGGGFSTVSPRATTAPWQIDAVNEYLAQTGAYPATPGYFNAAGRGYPDVSTYASNYFVYINGKLTRESGTSASAPVFAAMVTLWNDMRFTYGMQPMGFIAPFLYQVWATNPEAFNDIVTGNNACGVGHSSEDVKCCAESFAAVPGWDAVTGLGSPNFGIISNLVINPQSAFPGVGAFPNGVGPTYIENESVQDNSSNAGMAITALIAALCSLLLAVYAAYSLVYFEKQVEINGKRADLMHQ